MLALRRVSSELRRNATAAIPGDGTAATPTNQGAVECHCDVSSLSKPSLKSIFDSEMSS